MTTPITHRFWVVFDDGSEESWSVEKPLRDALADLAERLRFVPNYKNVRHKAVLADPDGFDIEII